MLMESPEFELGYYQDTLLKRLVRLLTIKPDNRVNVALRKRALFWTYRDCVAAGVTAKAELAINLALGADPRVRQDFPEFVFAPAYDDQDNEPRYCLCGHRFRDHGTNGECAVLMTRNQEEYVCYCFAYSDRPASEDDRYVD